MLSYWADPWLFHPFFDVTKLELDIAHPTEGGVPLIWSSGPLRSLACVFFSWFCCHDNSARAERTQVLWICRCKGRPRWSHDVTRSSPKGMLHMEGREQFICTNIYMSAPGLSVCCPLVSFGTNYEQLHPLLMPVILTPDECFDVGEIECNCRDK